MKKFGSSFPNLLLLTFALVSIVFFLSFKWVNNQWKYNIASDGKGYYVYLPTAFIYHDFSYQFTQETEVKYYPGDVQPPVAQFENGEKLNKYFVGEAILLSPFFLTAYILSYVFHFPLDGYSFIFQASISVAALFYALAGLWFLSRFLKSFIYSESIITFIVLIAFGASNLLHYTWMEPSMSHVYSFFAINVFMLLAADYFKHKNKNKLLLIFAVLGIICLIRPINGLVVLTLPFVMLLTQKKISFSFIAEAKWHILFGSLLLLLIVFIQLYLYHLQVGKWWIWAYANEGFNFKKSHLFEFTFSFRKGWFIYTPLVLVSVLSGLVIWRKNIALLLSFFVPLVVILFVASSWHDWAYGASFGCRPMVEFTSFALIPLALGIQHAVKYKVKAAIVFICWCFLLLNCIQTYQINKHILLWDNMSFDDYIASFLKTSEANVNMLEH